MIGRVLIVGSIAVLGRFMEDARKFQKNTNGIVPFGGVNLKQVYECLNVHLRVSIGMLGLVWSVDPSRVVPLFVFLLLGIGMSANLLDGFGKFILKNAQRG